MAQKEIIITKKDLEQTINVKNAETLIAKTTKPTCGSCGHVLDKPHDFVSIHLDSNKTIDWEQSEINMKLVLF